MKTSFLFPNSFKKVGWLLLIPGTILGIMVVFLDYEAPFLNAQVFSLFKNAPLFNNETPASHVVYNNLTNEIAGIIFLIGAILVNFSKEKQEDEYIAKVRLESLVWATYLNYGFLLLSLLLVYESQFLTFMVLNMFTLLIFFIIRFHLMLSQNNYSLKVHAE
ncbi:hypothetical protein AAE02nite_44820 [Adhaeribacter aerolatus]|uniref:Uncharacterized protein n=1 Tax=Adhaeribacter aerolatus TaxID=670289 RepID=A0A512B4D4_9BACT|nr:hypothetical protein [Adhaeribacter aerolatus]GEO06818.1 hypothetical protein AAE02nite_44820 [Adhaeribacter aerolatus]